MPNVEDAKYTDRGKIETVSSSCMQIWEAKRAGIEVAHEDGRLFSNINASYVPDSSRDKFRRKDLSQ